MDLILSNVEEMVNEIKYQSPLGNSDHLLIAFEFVCQNEVTERNTMGNNYQKGNYVAMKDELNNQNWYILLNQDKDEFYKSFLNMHTNS